MPEEPALQKPELLAAFVSAKGREKRRLFQILRPLLTAEDLEQVAPGLRDRSPKLAARVTSLLARHGRRDLLDANLVGLKPGKVRLLESQFRKIADAE